ncbi:MULTISPECIES: universal stress protein [Haloferacaceae]|uniref:Universal stress protein n=1 Tax=Halorubrum glutamatedens TaxID=2707018 RepID=A0ABD5QQP4_9EURY|nr:universal stress protein [Halobellus captivus]
MYRNILYPTDGSAGSEAAAEHVRTLASAFDATVHVLHVIDARHAGLGASGAFLADEPSAMGDQSAETGYEGMGTAEVDDAVTERAEAVVEEAAAALGDVETATAIEVGTPHSAVLRYADDREVDAIVMGTHGRTGVERYLLGSVTEKVVRMADVPVLTIRRDGVE